MPAPQPSSTRAGHFGGVGAAVCPHCQAYTSAASGYCQVCKRPLQGATVTPARAPVAPATYQPYPPQPPQPYAYGAPPPYPPQPAYPAAPGYGAPAAYPTGYGYPPSYGYAPAAYAPMYYAPIMMEEPCVALAKQTSGARWGAACLDLLIVFGVWAMLFFFVYPAVFGLNSVFFFLPRIFITALWFYLYYAVMDGFAGGTLGKRAAGLVLVDKQLRRISPGKAFGRAFEIFIWPFSFIIILLIQIIIMEKGGQSIGDKMAGTYLVRRASLPRPYPSA